MYMCIHKCICMYYAYTYSRAAPRTLASWLAVPPDMDLGIYKSIYYDMT